MSDQDEATAQQEATAKRDPIAEQRLQRLLLGTTLPLQEGGGIVFPRGFPGHGLRLDEWQFDRYRAELDRSILGDVAKRRERVSLVISLACGLLLAVLIFARDWVGEMLATVDILSRIGVPLLLAAVLTAYFALGLARKRDFGFIRQFEDAPKVGRFSLLYERAVKLLAAGAARPSALTLWAVITALALAALIRSDYFASYHPTLRVVLIAMLAYSTLRRLCMLGVFWHFRLRNGRAPTPEDLKPLSLSAS